MVEHFEYDELRVMKEVVLEQHELIKDHQYQEKAELDLPEVDVAIKEFRDIDPDRWFLADLFSEIQIEEDKKVNTESERESRTFDPELALYNVEEINDLQNLSSINESRNLDLPRKIQQSCFDLPSEILVKIFHLLTPPDRGRCAQVCTLWNELVYSSSLWREIYPIQWARGECK